MFQLSAEEDTFLRSQFVISKTPGRGGRRYRPYAFTEHGVAMLSSVLNSPRAVQVNIEIMRAFSRLRRILASHAELARKITRLEKKYDARFKIVFDAIRALMEPPETPPKDKIGYLSEAKRRGGWGKNRIGEPREGLRRVSIRRRQDEPLLRALSPRRTGQESCRLGQPLRFRRRRSLIECSAGLRIVCQFGSSVLIPDVLGILLRVGIGGDEVNHVGRNQACDGGHHEILVLGFALRKANREMIQVSHVYPQPFAVLEEQDKKGSYRDPFVAVLEGMVFDHQVEQDTCLCRQSWVGILPEEPLKWHSQAAFEDTRESGGEVWNWLIKLQVPPGQFKSQFLNFYYTQTFHYS